MKALSVASLGMFLLLMPACGSDGSVSTTVTEPASIDEAPPEANPTRPDPTVTGPTRSDPGSGSWRPAPRNLDGLEAVAGVEGSRLSIFTAGGERDFMGGVNLGASVPGHYPSELAIDRSDYERWIPMMVEMGFTSVRLYTIHPPGFYDALADFNRAHADTPLYLIQGVWPPEEEMAAHNDLLHPEVMQLFAAELERAVRVMHGDEPGYRADVSQWLAGWLIGYEWEPGLVMATDASHADRSPGSGIWVTALPEASATEVFLASMLDRLASAQAGYGTAAPLSFVNWPTTDPLVHPSDVSGYDDLVGIDTNHIDASGWPAGLFASYHAYPYFPDFIQQEPGLADAGAGDPYAGYLAALRDHHHGLPVVVAEFGVPGGWGHAHSEVLGRTHGLHHETDQMRINGELFETIHTQGLAGGLLFEWTDEWFKFTWNTLDYEQPSDRRVMWHNPFGAETWFGVIGVESGVLPVVTLDGSGAEWSGNGSKLVAESPGMIRQVRMVADSTFLSLRLLTAEGDLWNRGPIHLAFDVVEGGAPLPDRKEPSKADVLITLGPGKDGQIRQRAHYNAFLRLHTARQEYIPAGDEQTADSWNPLRLLIQRPQPGPDGSLNPAEVLDASLFRFAPSDPAMDGFDARAGWFGVGNLIEVRVPHMALGLADPSTLRALRITDTGETETVTISGLGLTVATGDELLTTDRYRWQPWDTVTWHERPKQGIQALSSSLLAVKQDR